MLRRDGSRNPRYSYVTKDLLKREFDQRIQVARTCEEDCSPKKVKVSSLIAALESRLGKRYTTGGSGLFCLFHKNKKIWVQKVINKSLTGLNPSNQERGRANTWGWNTAHYFSQDA